MKSATPPLKKNKNSVQEIKDGKELDERNPFRVQSLFEFRELSNGNFVLLFSKWKKIKKTIEEADFFCV
jgi:hypothetical protein